VKPTWKSASREIRSLANPRQAGFLMGFFKTGKGEYGEGDRFLGLKVPQVRAVARAYLDLSWRDLDRLVRSPYHEERLLALVIVADRAARAPDTATRKACYAFYVGHMKWINNWDLVDVTAGKVVGAWLWDHPRGVLFTWARSTRLWDRRVAVLATSHFIARGRFNETIRLSRLLLNDREDLMHKAVGWMLREVGKRDDKVLLKFLDRHAGVMPRTMLRYAVEKLPKKTRLGYMALR